MPKNILGIDLMIIFDVLTKTKNMQYQTGQAVINEYDRLVFIDYITKTTYRCISFHYITLNITTSYGKRRIKRPATEAEILAEAERNGWDVNNDHYFINGNHINIFKSALKGWLYGGGNSITTENLKELSEEGLIAHRLITALNLTK